MILFAFDFARPVEIFVSSNNQYFKYFGGAIKWYFITYLSASTESCQKQRILTEIEHHSVARPQYHFPPSHVFYLRAFLL